MQLLLCMVARANGIGEIQHLEMAPTKERQQSETRDPLSTSFASAHSNLPFCLPQHFQSLVPSMSTLLSHHISSFDSSHQALGRSHTLNRWPCSLLTMFHHSSSFQSIQSSVSRTNFAIVGAIRFHTHYLQACFLHLLLQQPLSPDYTQVLRVPV